MSTTTHSVEHEASNSEMTKEYEIRDDSQSPRKRSGSSTSLARSGVMCSRAASAVHPKTKK